MKFCPCNSTGIEYPITSRKVAGSTPVKGTIQWESIMCKCVDGVVTCDSGTSIIQWFKCRFYQPSQQEERNQRCLTWAVDAIPILIDRYIAEHEDEPEYNAAIQAFGMWAKDQKNHPDPSKGTHEKSN